MDPYLHLTALAMAAAAAAIALVAPWAATSRLHWFWRAVAVWAAVAVLLPIRAYEPAIVLAIGLPIAALAIRGLEWLRQGRREDRSLFTKIPLLRFGLTDLLLAMALLGAILAMLLHCARSMPESLYKPRTNREFVIAVIAVVAITTLSWCVARGVRPRLAAIGLLLAIPLLGWTMWPGSPWLNALYADFDMYQLVGGVDVHWHGSNITMVGLAEFSALLIFLLVAIQAPAPSGERRKIWQVVRLGGLGLFGIALGLLYIQMLRLTPFPPPLAGASNTHTRIRQIGERVESLNASAAAMGELAATRPEAADELRDLYQELFALLDGPNALFDDLSPGGWRAMDARTSPEWLGAIRTLSRALVAESKSAAAAGDTQQAVEFALADLRLGTMLRRNAIMIETLIGLALQSGGSQQLVALRDRVDSETARSIGDVLRSLEIGLEPDLTIVLRDMAYCERVYGWQARLSNIIAGLVNGPPLEWKGTREFVETIDRWRAINRLLQTDLAVRQFLAEKGKLPVALDELTPSYLPAVPLDPFTQHPLVHRAAGGQFTLYSAGRDRHDDGGKFTNRMTYEINQGYDFDLDTLTRP